MRPSAKHNLPSPLTKECRVIRGLQKVLEDKGYIVDKERKHLSPFTSTLVTTTDVWPPKEPQEWHPSDCIRNWFTHLQLSEEKTLAQILTPLAGKTDLCMKNLSDSNPGSSHLRSDLPLSGIHLLHVQQHL